jgi:hypothetical protein
LLEKRGSVVTYCTLGEYKLQKNHIKTAIQSPFILLLGKPEAADDIAVCLVYFYAKVPHKEY